MTITVTQPRFISSLLMPVVKVYCLDGIGNDVRWFKFSFKVASIAEYVKCVGEF